jgi:hypothetical protein
MGTVMDIIMATAITIITAMEEKNQIAVDIMKKTRFYKSEHSIIFNQFTSAFLLDQKLF